MARIGIIGSGTARRDLPAHFARWAAGGDCVPEIHHPRLSAFAFSPYERLLVDLGFVDAAQAAAAAGCDAVVLNSFADYGLAAARAALPVPVIGAGEAALRAGAAAGRRYAVVTVWPSSLAHLYAERLAAVPEGALCTGIRYVSPEEELARLGAEDGVMERMHRGERGVLERLAEECARAVHDDGAQAIVLGCTCMAPIGPALSARVAVPVIESSQAAWDAAVQAVAQPRARTAAAAARDTRLVPRLVDGWLAGPAAAAALQQAAGDAAAPVCEPCVSLERSVPSH